MARITINDVWARNSSDKSFSGPVNEAKIAKGWVAGEKPPHNAFNWMDNLVTQNMLDFTQMGILTWDKDTNYALHGICNYKGDLYQSTVATNNNKVPDTNPGVWKLATTPMAATPQEMHDGIRNDKMVTPKNLRAYLESIGIDIIKTYIANGHISFKP